MSKFKLLHIADLHLERKITHLPPRDANLRKSETLITFKNILDKFSDSDIVLISGDIFDGVSADETIEFVNSVFNAHSEKLFYVSAGNHDCLESEAIRKLQRICGPNVKIFSDVFEKVYVEEFDVYVHGISFSAPNSYSSLLSGFKVTESKSINLMVMHGDLNANSKYNPISSDEIASSGLDYLALGHQHKFSGFLRFKDTVCAYPGVPEPCGFDELDDCGVIYGEVEKGNVNLDFYPVSKRRYHIVDVDVSDLSSNEEIALHIKDSINPEDLYRINLCGVFGGIMLDIDNIHNLTESFYIEFNDLTQKAENILNYTDELSLRGKVASKLSELENEYDTEVFEGACKILTELMCRD